MNYLSNWRSGAGRLLSLAAASLTLAGLALADPVDDFLNAIDQDDEAETLRLLKAGADPNAANRYKVTPLPVACRNGNLRLVDALLQAGCDVNASLNGDHSALIVAARTGRLDVVERLLKAGAKVSARDNKGQTALMWAAVDGHDKVVAALLEAGADRDQPLKSGFNAWFFAARQGHQTVIDALLKDGADVNAVIEENGRGRAPRKGSSALILAVENGHFDLASALLEAGAEANDLRSSYTPLHALSWVRKPVKGDGIDGAPPPRGSGTLTSLQLVPLLMKHGADINARVKGKSGGSNRLSKPGSTPFLLAARTADLPLMKELLKYGADFRIPNKQGRTPLMAAAGVALSAEADEAASEDDAFGAINYLMELGADIDAVDKYGDTTMHAAAYKQAPKLVHLLAKHGADIKVWNNKNDKGWTPLLIAQGFRYGNFKPSVPTIAAFSKVMQDAGIDPPPPPKRERKKEKYGS